MENNKNNKDFEYTIVMDPGLTEEEMLQMFKTKEAPAPEADPAKAEGERLYAEYEKMCMKDPTVLDTDDIYPHSYQWRIGDKYDPDKIKVIKEALKLGERIADTEAYQMYLEEIKSRSYKPESWD
ncbi:MAG: hypothetical protein E7230_02470 [Clostridiales bacterium]|nr:hypothetical protein [Clostridiales bacterium]